MMLFRNLGLKLLFFTFLFFSWGRDAHAMRMRNQRQIQTTWREAADKAAAIQLRERKSNAAGREKENLISISHSLYTVRECVSPARDKEWPGPQINGLLSVQQQISADVALGKR